MLQIARQFAQALDAEDYPAARALLADGCVYTIRGETHRGPEAIVASYRANGDSGRETFDAIEYESRVEPLNETTAVIRFVDHLTHRGERFTFECEQRITVNEAGRIDAIEHIDLPGQREAFTAFMQRVGLE